MSVTAKRTQPQIAGWRADTHIVLLILHRVSVYVKEFTHTVYVVIQFGLNFDVCRGR